MLERTEVERLANATNENPGAREGQKALAWEVTKQVHGKDRAESARKVSGVLFGDTAFSQLSDQEIAMLSNEIPVSSAGSVTESLVSSGIVDSNSEAKRLIDSGAISVNGVKITKDQTTSVPSLIKKGKNSFILVR